jgi:hypothetical protein
LTFWETSEFDDRADIAQVPLGRASSRAWTSTLVAPKPFLETLETCRWKSLMWSFASSASSAAMGSPASMSAPSSMSPLAPAMQSK